MEAETNETERREMGIVVLGAVFVDIKGYPSDVYIPGGRNAGRVEQMHGGVSRNIVEDIACLLYTSPSPRDA